VLNVTIGMTQAPDGTRCLRIVKGIHVYVFAYRPGDENDVERALQDAARDPNSRLDWFDAAILTSQMRSF
jgi:hypothetical protein